MYDGLSGRGGAGASRADFGWVGGSPLGKVVPAAGGRRARALAGAGRRRVTFLRCASLPNRSWGRAFRCVQLPKRAKVKRRTAHPPPPAGWSRAQALTHRARRRRARRRGRAPAKNIDISRPRSSSHSSRCRNCVARAALALAAASSLAVAEATSTATASRAPATARPQRVARVGDGLDSLLTCLTARLARR